uniref:Uncharacterized protein n=1 Tax=Lactuca sativa TaxID=4236 RepID=A0A9R1WIZ8_LACSA|nr:hypothetical protein LSAT_V11C200090170 [Lactuca sativa]
MSPYRYISVYEEILAHFLQSDLHHPIQLERSYDSKKNNNDNNWARAVEQKSKRQVRNFNTGNHYTTFLTPLFTPLVSSRRLSLAETQYQFYSRCSCFLSTGCYNEDFRVKLEVIFLSSVIMGLGKTKFKFVFRLLETMVTFYRKNTFGFE